jgi:hypothetical protein
MLNDRADAVGIDHIDIQAVLDCLGELGQGALLQQPQHPNERPGPVLLIGSLQPSPQ